MVHVEKLPGQIRIGQIVMDVMEDKGIESKWYKNMVRWAVRGYTQLSIFHLDTFEEVKLTPSSVGICTVPDDYVNWVAIGMPYDGKFWTFTRDNRIITTTTTVDGAETQDSTQGEGVIRSSSSLSHYGETGGKNQYNIEWINSRQFIVNGTPSRVVLLRYVSSGINATDESSVSVLAQEALIAYVKKMWCERDPKSMAELSYWNDQFDQQKELLRFAQFPTIDDVADAIYETMTQTVKR